MPEAIAPDLLGTTGPPGHQTYFARQPTTAAEVDRACEALTVCPTHDLRYAGYDPAILDRLPRDRCDHPGD